MNIPSAGDSAVSACSREISGAFAKARAQLDDLDEFASIVVRLERVLARMSAEFRCQYCGRDRDGNTAA